MINKIYDDFLVGNLKKKNFNNIIFINFILLRVFILSD